MTVRDLERRLYAVLAVDIAGYTRLMEADEEDTHARVMRLRTQLLEPRVADCRGRIVKHTGDGFLASFDSVIDAAECAVTLQQSLTVLGAADASDRRIVFRMGLNLCDTIVEAGDIFGEGVNVAARLQSYAEPGGIVVSALVAEQIEGRFKLRSIDLGELHLRNIRRPVRAFSLRLPDQGAAATVWPLTADPRPSIAVLPFRQRDTDADEAYFANGIVDDIIRALASLKQLFVISRGSTLGFAGPVIDTQEVGRELGVRYVLCGSVNRSSGQLRITTELSDASTGAIIWAERHQGAESDLFGLQDRISTRVVATIAPHVRERELQRAMRKHPDSMDAYDYVLQAIDLLYRMDYKAFSGARGLLQLATAHDPDYAPAYAYAAQWHTFRVGQGWSHNPEADGEEASRLAASAIERDKYDAVALAICGHARSFLLRDYAAGRGFLDKALEAGPSYALAWTLSSCTFSYTGEGAMAISHAEHSLRLSPLDPLRFFYLCNLAIAHYANGSYDEAVSFARKAAGQKGVFRANLRTLAASLIAIDLTEEARAVAMALMEVHPEFRLSAYAKRCPWQDLHIRRLFIERLRLAGLPD